jgi:C-terminal processing protease CtpA/Prc
LGFSPDFTVFVSPEQYKTQDLALQVALGIARDYTSQINGETNPEKKDIVLPPLSTSTAVEAEVKKQASEEGLPTHVSDSDDDSVKEKDSQNSLKPATKTTKATGYLRSTNEKDYLDAGFPSKEMRMLSLFKFWNVIQYFYPYKSLVEKNWDEILFEFIPKLEKSKSALEYHITIAELVANCCDSHASCSSQLLTNHIGTHVPPMEIKTIEGNLIITFIDPTLEKASGFQIGDQILTLDAEDVSVRKNFLMTIIGGSTPQGLDLKVNQKLLAGDRDSKIEIEVVSHTGQKKKANVTRTVISISKVQSKPAHFVTKEGFAYMDTARIGIAEVDKILEAAKNAPGLILDVRGFPKRTIYQIAPRLIENKTIVALAKTPFLMPSMMLSELEPSFVEEKHTLHPSPKWKYKGLVAVLINEETVSHAEHSCLYLEKCENVRFVGTASNGTNGNITNCILPGGVLVSFTGLGTLHADHSQLQRKGIQPHVVVEQTVQGIVANRDEIFDAAIEYLNQQTAKPSEVAKEEQ